MTSSEIIKRARSLADIPNSKYISQSDEEESLWESYKDVYSKITDSSDDYYITEVILDTSTATLLGENEWEIILPMDVYKIRFVNYNDSGRWQNMEKFNTNERNNATGVPKYRWRGDKLWITASNTGLPTQIRLEYYPPAIKPSVPAISLKYGVSYAEYQLPNISSPISTVYNEKDYSVYIYNGTSIISESVANNNNQVTLYTGTNISNLYYNLGYLYYISNGNIYKAPTNLLGNITPVAIISTGNVVSFNIDGNFIWYYNGTDTISATLNGAIMGIGWNYDVTDVVVISNIQLIYYIFQGEIYHETTSNTNITPTGIYASSLTFDGTYLYYLSNNIVYKSLPDLLVPIVLADNIVSMSYYSNYRLMVQNGNYSVLGLSSKEDTDFDYPINEANEIMAYQSAIDYKRKAKAIDELPALQGRLGGIWSRFEKQLVRDEYKTESRISEWPRQGNWY